MFQCTDLHAYFLTKQAFFVNSVYSTMSVYCSSMFVLAFLSMGEVILLFILRIMYKCIDCIIYILPKNMVINNIIPFHMKIAFKIFNASETGVAIIADVSSIADYNYIGKRRYEHPIDAEYIRWD